MTITIVRPESSGGILRAIAADDIGSERSSNGGLFQEVHLDNANCFATVFLQEVQRPSPPPAPLFLPNEP